MGDPASLSCFANKVFDKVFDPIVTYLVIYPITALYLCKQNVMKLKVKLGELAIKKIDMQHKVDEAQQSGKEIFEEVKHWMREADEHIRENGGNRSELMELKRKAQRKYCFGLCRNPKCLYDLSKKAEEYTGVVDQLMQKAVQFDTREISYLHIQKLESINRDRGAQDGFVEFGSRKEVFNKIMKALQSPTVNMIGVHGMPGMGKTTLVKEVKRKAEEEKLFDVVVLANVTMNPDLTKIQYRIVRSLDLLNLSKEFTLEQVASLINKGLRKMNVLVILDDVWEKLDLEDLGIPSGTKQKRPVAKQQNEESSSREEQKECKVFITSRDPKVLSEMMGVKTDNIFPVNKLEDGEARELFKSRIEDDIESSESRRSKAIEIVNRCSGLPLAIEKMAVALRGKEDGHWSYLLEELKASKGGGYAVVRSAIEFSFGQLESEALKQTFLLCCLMGHNASIEDLIEYGTGLKLFPEVNKIEDVRDAARTLVGNLKGCSLLLDGSSNIQFDMQDAVRDAAISIASKDGGVLTFRDEDVAEVWPDEEAMKNLKRICLSNVDVSQLLQELELVHNSQGGRQQVQCPQLTFFHLSNKDPSSETAVPADFFKGMINLKVLSLSKMHFSSVPLSISLLTNLQTLRLNHSKLGVIEGMGEIIGKLKHLQVLNLAGCDITELPKEIEGLTMLKLLDTSDCTNLKVIPPNVLSKLSRLEELKMGNSFDQWQFVGQHEDQNENASLSELKHLQKLTTLELCINDIQMIPAGLFNAELKRYKIFIGDRWKYEDSSSENSKLLKLELKAGSSHSSVIKLLKDSEELHLEGLHGVKNVVHKLDNEGFQKLRYLHVRNAPEIQFMIDSERLVCSNAFPILEELVLQNMTKMEKICLDLGATSFSKLRTITIDCCHQLKNLFSYSVVKQLLQLQEISLKDCEKIEEIVAEEAQVTVHEIEEAATKIELGRVLSLRLEKLPVFISFCQEKDSSITDQGGSQLTSSRCMPLFNGKVVFPMLKELELTEIKIDKIWSTLAAADPVQKLTKLSVVSCSDLKYLFSSSLANGLVGLLHLEIEDCKSLREIITMETDGEMGDICDVKFPALKQLSIVNCSKLMGFMSKSKSTNEADDRQPFFNEQVAFPSLESLILFDLKNLRIIWHNRLPPDSFCKLSELNVAYCENLMTIFTKDMLGSFFKSIEKLAIWNCALVEEVFKVGEIDLEESVQAQLRNLSICGLPSLKHVWDKDPEGILTFHNLESVIVWQCSSIKNVFPASVARSLKQLQKLHICFCGVEEIVAMGREGTEAVVKFVFPRLSNLKLLELRRLRYFYLGKHVTLWPELKRLDVLDCGLADEMEMRNGQGQPDFPIQLPFLDMEEIIPHLERLSLSKDDITMISESRLKHDLFFNIKVLGISPGYGGESAILPIGFLWRFYNLEKLVLTNCSLKELFPSRGHGEVEEEEQKHFETTQVSRIKTLKLNNITNLQHLWSEDSSSVLQNLNTLKVIWCYDLISLSPSTASFKNVSTLEVWCCHKIENLVSVATVQSLVHVKSMTLGYCHMLSEIVRSEGDKTQNPIIFNSLRYLKLDSLVKLVCFSSGNCVLDFPYLEQLIVKGCPKLEIFSKIVPKTPRLLQVQGWTWWKLESDLNTTIQRMYTEKVGFIRSLALSLSEFPEMIQNWHTRSLQILDFRCLAYLDICNCSSLRYLLTPSLARSLVSLFDLKVENCTIMEAVIMEEGAQNVRIGEGAENKIILPTLMYISLDSCSDLTSFYVGSCTFQCVGLISIAACNCPKMATFASTFPREQEKEDPQAFFSSKVEFPNLETLILRLSTIQQIWHSQLNADSFCQLNFLEVKFCGKLLNIFPLSMMGRLQRLNELQIWNCESLKEIFQSETLGASSSQSQIPTIQKMFTEKVGYLDLKLSKFPEVIEIWSKKPQENLPFKRVKSLEVCNCSNLKYLLTHSMALGLVQLRDLKVTNCAMMEQVITGEGAEEIFPLLSSIILESCSNLTCFYEGSSKLKFSSLKQIIVADCPILVTFATSISREQGKEIIADDGGSEERLDIPTGPFFNDKVVLPNLEVLQLHWKNVNIIWHTSITSLCVQKLKRLTFQGCDNLEYLFSSSIARGLVMLEGLEIRKCKRMREIIVTENIEEKENMMFPQLNFLLMKDLQNLLGFYLGNCIVEFPSLEHLQVLNCPELKGFTIKYFESTNCIANMQTLFNEQVAFPNLEMMTITHLKNLEIIWHSKLYADSFCKLKSFTVENCENLSSIFPSADMEGRIWKSLEELNINQCGMLEGIFEIGEFNVKQIQVVIDTKLRELVIADLPRLKHVWNKDPQGILAFHNLESVEVSYCGSLKNLFPASIGKSLLQLQKLYLYQCGVEEIVTMGEQEAEEIVNFEFPRVSSLILEVLPRLQCLYPGKHTTKWPMLKEFCFSHFNQVKRTDGHGQLDFPVRLPLFSIKKIIPQLEKLSLGRHDIAMICEHESKQDILFNAKVLQIQDYLGDELDVLPIGFLKRFCHLENLIVRYWNLKELFSSKGEVEEEEKRIEIETLLRIKTLNLEFLPYLKHIWSHDTSSVLQNLETLDILRCDSLITLSTSISSFQNLTTLSVTSCKGMINLVSVSIAQSLVQLKRMTVDWCYMLTEIVGNEGDGMQDYIMITFTKLKFLTLKQLPRLESFCSENFTFKFPCLEEVTVNQCPKLKIFSKGDLNTPLLQRVSIEEEDKYHWEGDLNTTIQRAYMEEVRFAGLEILMLSEFPNLIETWHIKNPQELLELLDFRQLQVLEICNCSKFKYLLTHSMAMGLVQLFQLLVKNCGTMEQVIMGEGAKSQMEFPFLWLINLESCSDLTSFYVGSHSLELPRLNDFIVKDCPKMVTCAASTFSEEHDKEESQYLFSSKVETPDLEFLSLSSNNIQQILDNAISDISSYVQNLRKLCVEGCGNLKYLLTSFMVKSFERLNWLEIRACHMVEEVILAEESVDEERMCKIFFPNLEFLLLEDLPKLTRFCSGNFLELPCLWKLKISKCPVLKTFVSNSIFGDMIASFENVKNTSTLPLFDTKVAFPKLEHFVIEHVKSLNNIWNDQLEVDSFCQLTWVSVVSCEKLLNIFPFSMLERLQRLDKLQIWNCDSLEEILESQGLGVSQSQAQKTTPLPLLETITCLEDDVKDGIVFTKLKYLQLCGLPRLSSFCSVKCKFEFTFLEEVILMDCPSMQIFSMDEIRTPKLQKVKLARDDVEGFWAGNLNSTIQLLFKQKSQGDSEN